MYALRTRAASPPWVVLIAAGLAALWPLSAYGVNRLALPALLALIAAAYVVRRPAVGLAAALAAMPLYHLVVDTRGAELSLPSHPFKFVVGGLVVGVVVVGGLAHRRHSQGLWARRVGTAIALFTLVQVLAILFALDIREAARSSDITILAALAGFAILQACRTREDAEKIVAGVLVGLIIAAAGALLQAARGTAPDSFWVGLDQIARVQGPFMHPNHLGGYLAIGLVAAGAFVVRPVRPALRTLAACALLLGLPALYLTYSRGAIVVLVATVCVWLALYGPRRWLLAGLLVAAVGAAVMPSALRERFQPAQERADLVIRQDIWGAALDIAAERPLLGVGPGNFEAAYGDLPSVPTYASQRRLLDGERVVVPRHAHQHTLTQLAETGVIGLFAFAVLMLVCLGATIRGAQGHDPFARAAAAAGFMAIVAFLGEGVLDNAHPETIVLLLAIVAVAAAMSTEPVAARARSRPWR